MTPSFVARCVTVFALIAVTHATELANPVIMIQDAERFFKVYKAARAHPSAAQLDRDYLAPGTAGLHEFARLGDESFACDFQAAVLDPDRERTQPSKHERSRSNPSWIRDAGMAP